MSSASTSSRCVAIRRSFAVNKRLFVSFCSMVGSMFMRCNALEACTSTHCGITKPTKRFGLASEERRLPGTIHTMRFQDQFHVHAARKQIHCCGEHASRLAKQQALRCNLRSCCTHARARDLISDITNPAFVLPKHKGYISHVLYMPRFESGTPFITVFRFRWTHHDRSTGTHAPALPAPVSLTCVLARAWIKRSLHEVLCTTQDSQKPFAAQLHLCEPPSSE